MPEPLSLITPYHVGAVSVCAAFAAAGYSMCAPQWIQVTRKLELIARARDVKFIWAHWAWIGLCPPWVLERRVITILRDPIECQISDYIRGNARKAKTQARQWRELATRLADVDEWQDFAALDFSRYGIGPLPHENATGAHPLKVAYRQGEHAHVAELLGAQWHELMGVAGEIRTVFAAAGLSQRLAGTPFDGGAIQ